MACWTLVNFALCPTRKALLLELGGLARILRAMEAHRTHLGVQFRGLFALINLVVGGGGPANGSGGGPPTSRETLSSSEAGMEAGTAEVVECVLRGMEAFMDDPRLVNRGCLVLQNLSLTGGEFKRIKD